VVDGKSVTTESNIKAMVFDAYGTLFDVHSVIALCNELFPRQGAALSEKWRAKQLEYTWLRSLMGRYEDFWQVTEAALVFACSALHLDCTPAMRARLMQEYLRLEAFPEVVSALQLLSPRPLAILSNGNTRMLQTVAKCCGIDHFFAHVISVDEVKTYKPSPRVYELAPQKLKVDKTTIGFVSSNCWDVIGAKAFGFQTFWVNRSGLPCDQLGFTPDVVLKSLAELPPLVN
jgi:2-haloacid dehalogenase